MGGEGEAEEEARAISWPGCVRRGSTAASIQNGNDARVRSSAAALAVFALRINVGDDLGWGLRVTYCERFVHRTVIHCGKEKS